MTFFIWIWEELLFRPFLNILIGLYNTAAFENFGWAVVIFTVIVRIVLLPLAMKDQAGKAKEKEKHVREELARLQKSFGNNPAALREEQKKLFKQAKFRRWPKVISLAVQGLILLVLYQVFIGGINVAEVVDELYSFVSVPFQINTVFLRYFDVGERSFVLSFLSGFWLFGNIWFSFRKQGKKWRRQDLLYGIGFPFATFAILWILPSVKAIFILSSMIFSSILKGIFAFRKNVKTQNKIISEKHAEEAKVKKESLPKVKDRF